MDSKKKKMLLTIAFLCLLAGLAIGAFVASKEKEIAKEQMGKNLEVSRATDPAN